MSPTRSLSATSDESLRRFKPVYAAQTTRAQAQWQLPHPVWRRMHRDAGFNDGTRVQTSAVDDCRKKDLNDFRVPLASGTILEGRDCLVTRHALAVGAVGYHRVEGIGDRHKCNKMWSVCGGDDDGPDSVTAPCEVTPVRRLRRELRNYQCSGVWMLFIWISRPDTVTDRQEAPPERSLPIAPPGRGEH